MENQQLATRPTLRVTRLIDYYRLTFENKKIKKSCASLRIC